MSSVVVGPGEEGILRADVNLRDIDVSNTRCSLLPVPARIPPVALPLRFVSGVLT